MKNIKKQLNRLFQMQNMLLNLFKSDIKSNIDLKNACVNQISIEYNKYLEFRDFLILSKKELKLYEKTNM